MASVSQVRELKQKIVALFEDTESYLTCSFWNSFERTYGYLPDPTRFGVKRRSEFFFKFSDILVVSGRNRGKERIVHLRNPKEVKPARKASELEVKSRSQTSSQGKAPQDKSGQGTASQGKVGQDKVGQDKGGQNKGGPGKAGPGKGGLASFRIEESSSEEDCEGLPEEVMSRHHPYSWATERRGDTRHGGPHDMAFSEDQAALRNAQASLQQLQLPAYGAGAMDFPTLGQSAQMPRGYRSQGNPYQQPVQQNTIDYNHQGSRGYGPDSTRRQDSRRQGGGPDQVRQAYARSSGHSSHTSGQHPTRPTGHSSHPSGQPSARPTVHPSKQDLDAVVEDSVERLVDAKEYVSVEKVEKLVLQHYSVGGLQEIGGVRRAEDIPAINTHLRKQCKANAYIQAFARTRPIATLHELGQNLTDFVPDSPVDEFEELKLGPLQKQPLVYQHFKFPPESDVPPIDTGDVIDMLKAYLTEKNKWASRDMNMQEFMIYIKETRGFESPYEAGVKIKSLPLAVSVIKRAQRECGLTVKSVVTQQKEAIQDDIAASFRHFASNVLTKQVGYCQVKKDYLNMNAPEVILEVSGRLQLFMDRLHKHFSPTRAERKLMQNLQTLQSHLTGICSSNKLAEAVFRLAICCSEEEIHQQLWTIVQQALAKWEARQQEVIVLDGDEEGDETLARGQRSQKARPPLSDLSTKTRKYLDRCLQQGPLTLALLSKVEAKLCEDFEFPDFRALGHGGFLDLLAQGDLKKYLDECGGTTLGGVQRATGTPESLYHASQHDLADFVKQCGIADNSQVSCLEWAVCSHYRLRELKSLGMGSAKHLLDSQGRGGGRGKEPSVFYEAALCAKDKCLSSHAARKVGILGHQSREAALACLQNCPLLADLEDWSHWRLVFEPELGPLKEFVQKYGRVHSATVTEHGQKFHLTTHVLAMETRPGLLIKLASDSSTEKFAFAAEKGDAEGTCGHLLSLLATSKGLETLPTALLGNHMKTALIKIQAASGGDHGPGGPTSYNQPSRVCEFVVECLATLPVLVCQALANKVFLEPLASVVGKAKSKDQLLASARTSAHTSRLQVLGCALGVSEWVASFEARTRWPRDCMQPVERVEDGMGGVIESVLDLEEECSEDEAEVDETGTISLSDDDEDVADTMSTATASSSRLAVTKEEKGQVEEAEVIDVEAAVNGDSQDSPPTTVTMGTGQVLAESELTQGSSRRLSPCRAVVEQIRREEFGVAVALSEDGQRLMLKQQERLGRSLDRLSRDLYSKDTHFVLELIQNADDNDYPSHMTGPGFEVFPSVEFLVEPDQITVFNNECGFQEKNVKALCDVGRSTKGKHKYGYIGQKGIGFKSVFRVTDCPEIHSNGFHLRFDVNSGPMGYILPHWIGKTHMVKVTRTKVKDSKEESSEKPDEQKAEEMESDGVIVLDGESEGSDQMEAESEAVIGGEVGETGGAATEEEEEVEEEEDEEDGPQEWTTRIVLPLKEEVRSQNQTLSLAARFHDVHPSLLLFLHRLRRLRIVNQVEGYTLDITRRDLPHNLVEIRYRDSVDRWLVVKQTLDASHVSKQAKSGVEVESTEIALAFQLQEKQETQTLPDKQPVFAFLPLRSYGFRFVIQGDFDVPSSREDVDRDSVWNQWILGEIHKLFVDSVQTFKDLPSVSAVDAVCSFLQYVPMEDEILDFFRPVASRIMQQLRARPCLPTQPAKGKAPEWRLPSQLVITRDPLVTEVVTGELLQTHLNLAYVHAALVERVSPSLLVSLGVQSLTTQHLLDTGRVIVDRLNQTERGADLTPDLCPLSKWLTCVYRSLDEFHQNEDVLSQLRVLPIIPLTDGQMVKLSEKTVFFPLADERKHKKQNKVTNLIQTDMNTIDKRLFSRLDDVSNSQVRRLLETLGVKSLSARDVIHHHIMPILRGDLWKTRPRDVVVAYTMYMRQHLEDGDGPVISLEDLKPHLVVETNQGLRKPVETPVHFTQAYLNPVDLPSFFPGHKWVLLDSRYLEGAASKEEVQKWYKFFSRLGVLNYLAIKREEVCMTRKQMEDSPWEKFLDVLPVMESYRILDCECSEFYSLVIDNDHEQSKYQQMKNLFMLLDQQFDSEYKQYTVAKVMAPEGHVVKHIDSTFAMLLRQVPWLPAAVMRRLEDGVEGELMEGTEIYVRSPNTERLFSHHVPYLDTQVSPNSSFSQFLGIRSQVRIEDVVERLIAWSSPEEDEMEESGGGGPVDRPFTTSMGHIKAVYSYLQENLVPKRLQDLFQENSVIFHTLQVPTSSDVCVPGAFLSRSQVRWSDPSGLFDKYRPVIQTRDFQKACRAILSKHYPEPNLKDLLVKVALVQKHPEVEEYGRMLIELCAVVPPPAGLPDILKIYEILGESLAKVKSEPPSPEKLKLEAVRTLLKDQHVVPLKGHKLTYPEEEPLIADDAEKEMQWKGKPGVNFVDHGGDKRRQIDTDCPVDQEKVLSFLEYLGIPRLSARVEVSPVTESYRPCPELQYYVHRVTPFIQQLLYHEFDDIYWRLVQGNVGARLATLNFAQVSKLELVQHLQVRSPPPPIIKQEKCRLVGSEFYVHTDGLRDYDEINIQLTRFFCPDSKQAARIMRSMLRDLKDLVVDASRELDELMQNQQLDPLPDGEALWEVRAPVNWPPRPPTPPPPIMPGFHRMEQMEDFPPEMREDPTWGENAPRQSEDTGAKRLTQWPPPAPSRGRYRDPTQMSDAPDPLMKPPAPADPIDTSSLPAELRPSKLTPYRRDGDAPPGDTDRVSEPRSPHSETHADGQTHRQHSQHSAHSEGQGHRHQGQSQDTERAQHPSVQTVPHGEGGSSGADSGHTSGSQAGRSVGGAGGEDASRNIQAMEEDETRRESGEKGGGAEGYSRSQSQVELEYIGSHGNQDTVSVDEGWVGEAGEQGGQRKSSKRPRTESHGEERGTLNGGEKGPVVFYGNPTWTETANETLYEELAQSSEIPVPKEIELEDNAAAAEIGRWGESLVNSYLLQEKTRNPESEITEVLWVNEEKESSLPYDIVLKVRDPLTNELQPVYIEVKSTLSDKKAFFEISSQEFKFAQHWHQNFHIYRVFNAGDATTVRLTKLVNLADLLDRKQVKLCMVV